MINESELKELQNKELIRQAIVILNVYLMTFINKARRAGLTATIRTQENGTDPLEILGKKIQATCDAALDPYADPEEKFKEFLGYKTALEKHLNSDVLKSFQQSETEAKKEIPVAALQVIKRFLAQQCSRIKKEPNLPDRLIQGINNLFNAHPEIKNLNELAKWFTRAYAFVNNLVANRKEESNNFVIKNVLAVLYQVNKYAVQVTTITTFEWSDQTENLNALFDTKVSNCLAPTYTSSGPDVEPIKFKKADGWEGYVTQVKAELGILTKEQKNAENKKLIDKHCQNLATISSWHKAKPINNETESLRERARCAVFNTEILIPDLQKYSEEKEEKNNSLGTRIYNSIRDFFSKGSDQAKGSRNWKKTKATAVLNLVNKCETYQDYPIFLNNLSTIIKDVETVPNYTYLKEISHHTRTKVVRFISTSDAEQETKQAAYSKLHQAHLENFQTAIIAFSNSIEQAWLTSIKKFFKIIEPEHTYIMIINELNSSINNFEHPLTANNIINFIKQVGAGFKKIEEKETEFKKIFNLKSDFYKLLSGRFIRLASVLISTSQLFTKKSTQTQLRKAFDSLPKEIKTHLLSFLPIIESEEIVASNSSDIALNKRAEENATNLVKSLVEQKNKKAQKPIKSLPEHKKEDTSKLVKRLVEQKNEEDQKKQNTFISVMKDKLSKALGSAKLTGGPFLAATKRGDLTGMVSLLTLGVPLLAAVPIPFIGTAAKAGTAVLNIAANDESDQLQKNASNFMTQYDFNDIDKIADNLANSFFKAYEQQISFIKYSESNADVNSFVRAIVDSVVNYIETH